MHCSTHLKNKIKKIIPLPNKIIKLILFFSFFYSVSFTVHSDHSSPSIIKHSSPSLISLTPSSTHHHRRPSLSPRHRHRSVPPFFLCSTSRNACPPSPASHSCPCHRQEHELAKRRWTGEENPLPDIGITSMSQAILEWRWRAKP